MTLRNFFATLLLGIVLAISATAAELRVAVAANFTEPMKVLAGDFEKETGHRLLLIFASTGKIYAQITNGAPFDLFFAADSERPRRLEEAGMTVPGTRRTYAVGRLVLWSIDPKLVDEQGKVLGCDDFRHLAIANPRLAPYGRAAQEVLETLGVWPALQERLVQGENIGQTYAFVHTGNAELGFVAASQIHRPGQPVQGSSWQVPQHLHSPIEQQMVVLNYSAAAHSFDSYTRSERARALIRSYGYGTP